MHFCIKCLLKLDCEVSESSFYDWNYNTLVSPFKEAYFLKNFNYPKAFTFTNYRFAYIFFVKVGHKAIGINQLKSFKFNLGYLSPNYDVKIFLI